MGELLERGAEVELLGAAIADARSGSGSMVLVCGEAGIGKTSLVRAFARGLHGVRLLAERVMTCPRCCSSPTATTRSAAGTRCTASSG